MGFKLTVNASFDEAKDQALKLSLNSTADYIVENDLKQISSFAHSFAIFKRNKIVAEGRTADELSKEIFRLVKEHA